MESEKLNAQEQEEEVVEEDDGPPPGFQSIINNDSSNSNKVEEPITGEGEDEGPPPGFEPVSPISQFALLSSDKKESHKQDAIDDDGDDGPPPGWEFSSIARALPETPSVTSDIRREEKEELNVDEEDDDGPPPGWEKILPHQMTPPCVLQPQQSSNVSSDLSRSKQDVAKNNDQEPQIVSENNLTGQSSPPDTPVQQLQPSTLFDTKGEEKEELNVDEEDDEGPPPGWENVLPHQVLPPCVPQVQQSPNVSIDLQFGEKHDVAENNDKEPQIASQDELIPGQSSPHETPVERGKGETRNWLKSPSTGNKSVSPDPLSPDTESFTELAQLVCFDCRKLCTYPRGVKLVQCPSCMEVNFAMEEHEIGQVMCNGCATLLMYPYGSPAVQCSSCNTVTEIEEENMGAPLSEQQNQRPSHPSSAH